MQFKANLLLTLLAILVLTLLVSLGFWQLDRAKQKQHLLDLQTKRLLLEPVDLSSIDLSKKNLRYLPVKVSGKLDVEHQILIDNQIRRGQVGFSVLTPLRINERQAILLNRGWVPMNGERKVSTEIEIKTVNVSIHGKLDHFPSVGIKLKNADQLSDGWPSITQVVEIEKVEKRLGYSVMGLQLLLDEGESNGYNRDWVVMKMGPEKHHGYAFQWFALATAWVIIYFVLTVKKGVKKDEFNN